jgi:hypothetical protein
LILSFGGLYENLATKFFQESAKSAIVGVIITLIAFLISAHFSFNLYMFLYKKLYIEAAEDYLKVKKAFKTQIIKISEINSIRESIVGGYQYGFRVTMIIIKTKSTFDRKRGITIKFLDMCFSNNEISNLIFSLRKRNKRIQYFTKQYKCNI